MCAKTRHSLRMRPAIHDAGTYDVYNSRRYGQVYIRSYDRQHFAAMGIEPLYRIRVRLKQTPIEYLSDPARRWIGSGPKCKDQSC